MKIAKKLMKTIGFSLIFKVPGGFWRFENLKKSKKVGSERRRGANNDSKRGQARLQERKMTLKRAQEGPAGAQKEARVALTEGRVV